MMIRFLKGLTIAVFTWTATIVSAGPHWTHEEQAEWGAIRDNSQTIDPLMFPYATCSIGKHQSPVDLSTQDHTKQLNKLKFKYTADHPVFYNSGHGVQVNTSDDYQGYLKIGAEIYPLIQFHFHEPSEHVLEAKYYPAELHFVHVREDGKIAVLGVLIEEGHENSAFQVILDNFPREEGAQNEHSGIQLNPGSLLPQNKKDYYALAGSLTTPPCSEGVNWFILVEPITISPAQLLQLKELYTDNARHIQNLNGRSVSRKLGKH